MNVLVTGGCGYLGSVLVRVLLEKGHFVRILDSGLYGIESISDILDNPNLEAFVKYDMRDLTSTAKALEGIHYVVHLAGLVGAQASSLDKIETMEINQLSTHSLAIMCEIRDIPLLFASTCSVYGVQPGKMLDETSKVKPQESYADHKLTAEKLIQQNHRSPCIFRFGTLFGLSHRMRFDLVINKFIAMVLSGQTMTVEGGQQVRPFLHVKDAAEAISFAIEKNLNGIYNVISTNMTILHAAEIIKKCSGGQYEIKSDINDNRDYSVSMQKISYFGYTPKRTIEHAYNEIAKEFDLKKIDYTDKKYSNYDSLLLKSK